MSRHVYIAVLFLTAEQPVKILHAEKKQKQTEVNIVKTAPF